MHKSNKLCFSKFKSSRPPITYFKNVPYPPWTRINVSTVDVAMSIGLISFNLNFYNYKNSMGHYHISGEHVNSCSQRISYESIIVTYLYKLYVTSNSHHVNQLKLTLLKIGQHLFSLSLDEWLSFAQLFIYVLFLQKLHFNHMI